ncbi:MAG: metalloprotease [Verrucomicrobia bacterium]|nr:MAG: metalloprotease [Verrucomicrobiota bacterium]
MQWKGRRKSEQVEDARGQRGPMFGGAGGGGGGIGMLITIGRMFGFKGILAALVLGVVLWKVGIIDMNFLLGGGAPSSQSAPVQSSAEEDEQIDFARVVLADTEDVWTAEFSRNGMRYELPAMKVYRDRVQTACGAGQASMGPFYCPGDKTVYLDLSFYSELAETFQAPGDFAQAYVIAHEVGHHVQNLLGTSAKVQSMRGRPDYNQYSVRLELQADYYAGVWAHHTQKYLDHGDVEEAMRAANAIGDDAIQKKSQGRVVPHAFTHGTSEQRMRWFSKGLKSGKIEEGDTFAMAYDEL